MEEQLKQFINEKRNEKLISLDEAATKQSIVLRLLSILGWNIYDIDEVNPEYSIGGKSVDYSLRINGKNKVFIEVKRIKEELENHQEQLLSYAFREGISLAVLTNGISWWFYLPLQPGSDWERRKFLTINIIQQKNKDEIVTNFIK
ncbi:MAG: type I restriction endonuclease, partial [Candidatus Nealsonbacteria bacterium]